MLSQKIQPCQSYQFAFKVAAQEAQEFANSVDAIYAETSALTSHNVHFLFEELCKFHITLRISFQKGCVSQKYI
jgi:hypothetical protein